jgi:tripeptidyl-peptidase-1
MLTDGRMILRESSNHGLMKQYYAKGNRVASDVTHDIMISIKQNNQDKLKEIVDDISNLASPNYGKYLSFDEVGKLVSNADATIAVKSWLIENNVEIVDQTEFGEYIYARSTVGKFEQLFETTFHEFKSTSNDEAKSPETVIRAMSYSLPEHLDAHIHSVHKLTSLPPITFPSHSVKTLSAKEANQIKDSRKLNVLDPVVNIPTSGIVTPQVLQSMYSVFGDSNNLGSQSVYGGYTNTYSQDDIAAFLNQFAPGVSDTIINLEPIPNPEVCYEDIYYIYYGTSKRDYCASASTNLEYITSVAGNIDTFYYYDSASDFIGWIVNITNLENPPLVNVVPDWTYEVFVDTADLATFETEAIKLSARGVTIITGSGNDGVTGTVTLTYEMRRSLTINEISLSQDTYSAQLIQVVLMQIFAAIIQCFQPLVLMLLQLEVQVVALMVIYPNKLLVQQAQDKILHLVVVFQGII